MVKSKTPRAEVLIFQSLILMWRKHRDFQDFYYCAKLRALHVVHI